MIDFLNNLFIFSVFGKSADHAIFAGLKGKGPTAAFFTRIEKGEYSWQSKRVDHCAFTFSCYSCFLFTSCP